MPADAATSSNLARAIVLLNALVFAGIGVAFLAAPTEMAAIVAVDATSALARNDVRAIYGGLELGLGLALLAALRAGELGSALRTIFLIFAAMVSARLLSLAVDGRPEDPGTLLLGLEVLALGAAALGLRVSRVRSRPR